MTVPWTKAGLSLAFPSALLFYSIVLFKLSKKRKRDIKPFSRVVDNANFPYFKQDNFTSTQWLNVKLSGHVVTAFLLRDKLKWTNLILLQFGKEIAISIGQFQHSEINIFDFNLEALYTVMK